jgi:hypothetical protein
LVVFVVGITVELVVELVKVPLVVELVVVLVVVVFPVVPLVTMLVALAWVAFASEVVLVLVWLMVGLFILIKVVLVELVVCSRLPTGMVPLVVVFPAVILV